jgi:hypothetical protein
MLSILNKCAKSVKKDGSRVTEDPATERPCKENLVKIRWKVVNTVCNSHTESLLSEMRESASAVLLDSPEAVTISLRELKTVVSHGRLTVATPTICT